MSFFEFIIAFTAIGGPLIIGVYVVRRIFELREKQSGFNKDWEGRFQRLEQRIANLETIVLEREKHKEFERAR
jgi:hypothetical protein